MIAVKTMIVVKDKSCVRCDDLGCPCHRYNSIRKFKAVKVKFKVEGEKHIYYDMNGVNINRSIRLGWCYAGKYEIDKSRFINTIGYKIGGSVYFGAFKDTYNWKKL